MKLLKFGPLGCLSNLLFLAALGWAIYTFMLK